jgi:hypothetical protein
MKLLVACPLEGLVRIFSGDKTALHDSLLRTQRIIKPSYLILISERYGTFYMPLRVRRIPLGKALGYL